MVSDKQTLEVQKTYFVWDGFGYSILWEVMMQPNGRMLYVVETKHMSGGINGRRFICEDERNKLMKDTYDYLNK